jgi:hypothetical protein
MLAEQIETLHKKMRAGLNDATLFRVFDLWTQGLAPEEIACQIDLSRASVYRKLRRIEERAQELFLPGDTTDPPGHTNDPASS